MDARRKRTVRAVYWGWRRKGMTDFEAGNLVARSVGLSPHGLTSGWRVSEIDRLLFLRYLVWTHRVR